MELAVRNMRSMRIPPRPLPAYRRKYTDYTHMCNTRRTLSQPPLDKQGAILANTQTYQKTASYLQGSKDAAIQQRPYLTQHP